MDRTFFGVIGWRGDRIELERARFIGCDAQSFSYWSVDPTAADWRIDAAPGHVDDSAADGHSVVLTSGGRLIVIHENGQVAELMPSSAGPLGKLVATTYGGYVFVGTPRLDRLGADLTSVASIALPAGYALAAPTSDPKRFILALASEAARLPWGLTKEPYHAYLWTVGSSRPALLATSVSSVAPSATWLAYLSIGTSERAVGRDGSVQVVQPQAYPDYRSPDDREYLDAPAGDSAEAQTLTLRSAATGRALATLTTIVGTLAWSGATVAFVPRGDAPATDLVVMRPGSVLTLPLPLP